ncbi:hypothetical protein PIROE2DRAFT_65630 [Piromyces sp. E2]|nr:hypothetical protein PIROE2DRAFT_65630 [Piromyces sp. E2]|eukprot:OUM56272.1 hypothetical protein PIROE2DRAFT_65630 [Piromyces sp. E2]
MKEDTINKLESENENLKYLLNTLKGDINIKESLINSFNSKIKERDKIKSLEEQIDNIKDDNEECKQLKQEMKLLKNNISRKDEMIITNKNKIKELTNNNEEYKEQIKNYKELNIFNANKSQLLNEKINIVTSEKTNLQLRNDKLSKVLKKITEYLLSKYKDIILGNKIDNIIDNNLTIPEDNNKFKDEEFSFSYDKKEIVEKIKNISEKMLNIDFKDVINPNKIDKYTKHNEEKNKNNINKEFLFQYEQTINKFNQM